MSDPGVSSDFNYVLYATRHPSWNSFRQYAVGLVHVYVAVATLPEVAPVAVIVFTPNVTVLGIVTLRLKLPLLFTVAVPSCVWYPIFTLTFSPARKFVPVTMVVVPVGPLLTLSEMLAVVSVVV